VFKSTNGGANWSAINNGLTNTYVWALAIAPQTPSTVYVGTWGGGVFKSTNGGANWNASNIGLTNTYVRALAIDPQTPSTVYVGTGGGGMFKSTNGGANWSAINSGLTETDVGALAIDPQTPSTVYAGTYAWTDGGGVFKSTNGGANWSAINSGLTDTDVLALAINPQTPSTIYAGTWRGGVFVNNQTTYYSISGRVTDANNNPISGVTVSAGAGHTATTDSNGYYAFGGLAAGTYTITPSKSGYTFSPASHNATVPPDAAGQNFTGTLLTYSISGRVTDTSNNPITGVIISDGTGHSTTTDSNGDYTLSSLAAGTYTLTSSKTGYTFSPALHTVSLPPNVTGKNFTGVPVPTTLINAINQYASRSNVRIDQVSQEALTSAQDGDYFAVQSDAHQIDLVVDAIVDSTGILAKGFDTVEKTQTLLKVHMPGAPNPSDWDFITRLRDQYGPARRIFSSALLKPVTTENAKVAAKVFLDSAHVYYAADFTNKWADEILTDKMLKDYFKFGLQSNLALQSRMYPSQQRLADVFKQDINNTAAYAATHLPALTSSEQTEYIADLSKREKANTVMASTLERRGLPLHLARSAGESDQDDWIAGFLAKYGIESLAFLALDGPGVLAVEIGAAYWDLYQNVRRVSEDVQMMTLGVETLGGAVDTQRRIHTNWVKGMDNIVNKTSPQIPDADSIYIVNKSVGEYQFFGLLGWFERESSSEVRFSNKTGFATVFQVIGNYGNSSGIMGISYQPLVREGVTRSAIPGNQSSVVRLRYKQNDQGASPDDNSVVEMELLGSTDTGTYYVLHTSTLWQPLRLTKSGQRASVPAGVKQSSDTALTLPYPIRSRVDTRADSLTYIPHLWVDNPFTQTVLITVTQPLPTGIQVINANGGTVAGQTISWSRNINPRTTVEITHVVTYAGPAGATLTYPEAQLSMSDLSGTTTATFTGNVATFQSQTPLLGNGLPPSTLLINQTTTVPVTITNHSSAAVTGTARLTLNALSGAQVYSTSQNVNLAPSGTLPITLPLRAPAQDGTYILRTVVDSNGGTYDVFATYLDVTAKKIYLPVIQK
jgi:hypothetical protein